MPDSPQSRAEKPLRVLLIERDDTVRQVLQVYLSRRGHAITQVGNRREGLHAMSSSHFDVVLTNVLLPDGNGIDVINHVAGMSKPARVVAMLGRRYFGPKFFKQLAATLGAQVLEKPFGPEQLIAAVEG